MWSAIGSIKEFVVFDLGKSVSLTKVYIWNYDVPDATDVGMKDVGGEISDQKQPSRRILSGRAGERPNERDEILVRVEAADVQEVRIPRREAARAQPLLARRALANRLEDRCRSLGSGCCSFGRGGFSLRRGRLVAGGFRLHRSVRGLHRVRLKLRRRRSFCCVLFFVSHLARLRLRRSLRGLLHHRQHPVHHPRPANA